MANATETTVTVTFDPTATSKQADIIGPATPTTAGAMTAAQAAKLAILSPGSGATLTQVYNLGTSSADQTANIDPLKGGGIVAKAKAALTGRLLAALDSLGGVIFDVVDDAVPKVLAAGAFVKNVGWPVMGSQTPDGYMSYTSDGIGGAWGGTGMTAKANSGSPDIASVDITVNDVQEFIVKQGFVFMSGQCTNSPAPLLPIVAGVISPLYPSAMVGAGNISTISVPVAYPGASFSVDVIPTAAFTWDATGNIFAPGTAIAGRTVRFTYDGSPGGKFYASYY